MDKKLLLLLVSIFISLSSQAQIASVSPNIGYRGQVLSTTISMTSGILLNATPPLDQTDIYLEQGATRIGPNSYLDCYTSWPHLAGWPNFGWSDSITLSFIIPGNAPLGFYNLYMRTTEAMGVATLQSLMNAVEIKDSAGTISGIVYFDANQNGAFDGNDFTMPNQRISIAPYSEVAFTNAAGAYTFIGASDTYTASLSIPIGYTLTTTPSSYTHTIPPSSTGNDFGMYIVPFFNNTQQILNTRIRCNRSEIIYPQVQNRGNVPITGSISLIFSANMLPYSFVTPPDYISGDTLTWNYSVLNPYQIYYVPDISVNTPGPFQNVSITMIDSIFDGLGNFQSVETKIANYEVRCSFDPNDKSVTPEGSSAAHYTPINDPLEYLIQFQNTGNDTAYDVVIVDSISDLFDLNTLEIVGSSDLMDVQYNAAGVVQFRFINIFLPDSNIDEPGSHGWLRYRIQARAGIPDPSVVTNTAYIYFDNNLPVITNSTMNTLTALQYPVADFITLDPNICQSDCISFANQSQNGTSYSWNFTGASTTSSTDANPVAICYPNAGSYDVTLIATNALGSDTITQAQYINVSQGPVGLNVIQSGDTLIAPAGYATYQWYFNNNPIVGATSEQYVATANGDYALSVTNANGCSAGLNISNFSVGVDALSLNGGGMIVYPNPSSGNFDVKFNSNVASLATIELLDKVGQIVASKMISTLSGSNEITFNDLNLASGIYTIKLKTNDRIVTKLISINH
jgi:uncharacterized repeat protein (TIGR01451 family)